MVLVGESYIYTGKDNISHKNGKTYQVVSIGEHWVKEFGNVIWVTTEKYGDTLDIDYCHSYSPKYFKHHFYKAT